MLMALFIMARWRGILGRIEEDRCTEGGGGDHKNYPKEATPKYFEGCDWIVTHSLLHRFELCYPYQSPEKEGQVTGILEHGARGARKFDLSLRDESVRKSLLRGERGDVRPIDTLPT